MVMIVQLLKKFLAQTKTDFIFAPVSSQESPAIVSLVCVFFLIIGSLLISIDFFIITNLLNFIVNISLYVLTKQCTEQVT